MLRYLIFVMPDVRNNLVQEVLCLAFCVQSTVHTLSMLKHVFALSKLRKSTLHAVSNFTSKLS